MGGWQNHLDLPDRPEPGTEPGEMPSAAAGDGKARQEVSARLAEGGRNRRFPPILHMPSNS